MNWEPISTAPRDQTDILVANSRAAYVASWWGDDDGEWICYMDAIVDPPCPINPTHWMPLPDLPRRG